MKPEEIERMKHTATEAARPYINLSREVRVLRTRLLIGEAMQGTVSIGDRGRPETSRRITPQEVDDLTWILDEMHRLNVTIHSTVNENAEQAEQIAKLQGELSYHKSHAEVLAGMHMQLTKLAEGKKK